MCTCEGYFLAAHLQSIVTVHRERVFFLLRVADRSLFVYADGSWQHHALVTHQPSGTRLSVPSLVRYVFMKIESGSKTTAGHELVYDFMCI